MRITFSPFGHLRRYLPSEQDSLAVELPEGATVADLLQQIGISWGEVGIIQISGRQGDEESILRDGDRVEMFAPIGGGQQSESRAQTRADLYRMFSPLGRLWLRARARFMEVVSDLTPRELNLAWVNDQLAVGGSFRDRDVRHLAARGIGAVLDLREEASDNPELLARHGIRWLRLPVPDREAPSPEQFDQGRDWVQQQLAEGRKVLVHCEHGVGRAVLMGCAVLIGQGHSAQDALTAVRARRWQASPNDRQLTALLNFEAACRSAEHANPTVAD